MLEYQTVFAPIAALRVRFARLAPTPDMRPRTCDPAAPTRSRAGRITCARALRLCFLASAEGAYRTGQFWPKFVCRDPAGGVPEPAPPRGEFNPGSGFPSFHKSQCSRDPAWPSIATGTALACLPPTIQQARPGGKPPREFLCRSLAKVASQGAAPCWHYAIMPVTKVSSKATLF